MIFSFQKNTAKFVGLCCFFFISVYASSQRDTTEQKSLGPVTVIAFPENLRLLKIPGTVSLIPKERWSANDQTSLQSALNSIPGVSLESRGYGGSQRINIRGNFLRNPFAVRNVKMYLDGIPLSSPDGTAPLEMIDAFDVQSMDVLKGPIGSLYGSGTGGALLITPKLEMGYSPFAASASMLVGEYGLFRTQNDAYWRKKRLLQRLSAVYQENKGYRNQEANRKMNVTYTMRFFPNEKRSVLGYFNFFNGNLELPGSINATQVKDNPRQANAFSVANNAALYRTRLFGALSYRRYFIKGQSLSTNVYGMYAQKYNPYGTSASYSQNGFKDEQTVGYGFRSTFKSNYIKRPKLIGTFNAGGELQIEHFDGTEWTNAFGRPGDLKYNYKVDYLTWLGFVSTDVVWRGKLFANIGASINQSRHNISAISQSFVQIDSLATWQPNVLPRVALLYQFNKWIAVHGSMSYGNSNPTVNEQVEIQQLTSVTGFAESYGLQPEHGINYEVGLKSAPNGKLLLELTAYQFELKQAILPYSKEVFVEETQSTEEFTLYTNAGRVMQKGVEFSANYNFMNESNRFFSHVDLYFNGQLTEYTFGNYALDQENFAGLRIPGMPISSLNTGVKCTTQEDRVSVSIQHNYVDRIPINNSNTVWTGAYHLVNFRIDTTPRFIRKSFKNDNKGSLKLSFGINNLLDTSYTSFLQTNGFGGRYFNPAPVRNYYAGITLLLD